MTDVGDPDYLAGLAALRPGIEPPDLLADLLQRPAWHAEAACRGKGTDLFFPNAGQPATHAKAICATCPVTEECLEAALVDPLTVGVWAGKSPAERAQVRKARNNAA